MTIAPSARAAARAYPGRVVLISAATVPGGFVARIRQELARGDPAKGRIGKNGDVRPQHPPSCGGGPAT